MANNKKKEAVQEPKMNKKQTKQAQERGYRSMGRQFKIMLLSPFSKNRFGQESWTKELRKYFCAEDKPRLTMEYEVKGPAGYHGI
jgi:hypothetical protein